MNRAYKSRGRSADNLQHYQMLYDEYRLTVRNAKKESWRDFCSPLSSSKDIAKSVRVLRNEAQATLGLITGDGSSYAQSPEQALQFLLKTHFPDSSKEEPEEREILFPRLLEDVEYIKESMVKHSLYIWTGQGTWSR